VELAKRYGQELIPTGSLIESLKNSARHIETWALVALYFVSFGGFLALTGWFIVFWVQSYGFEVVHAGLLMAFGFSLLASVIRIFGGWLSDKIGGELVSIIAFSMVLIGAITIILGANTSFFVSLTGEILMGAGMGIANGAVFKLVPKYVPHATGGAAGWVGGLGAFGGFVVPPILGLFVQNYGITGYSRGFIVYIILSMVAIIISTVLWKAYGKEINQPIEE